MRDEITAGLYAAGLGEQTLKKWEQLLQLLKSMGSAGVALSGGVDSSLLSAAAYLALGDQMVAMTAHSPVEPPGDMEGAATLARQFGFQHQILEYNNLDDPEFVSNPPERCYHCKLGILRMMREIVQEMGYSYLLEGSNADDGSDYRPGRKAVAELGVRSPLAETDLTKNEIRSIARVLKLTVWDRPSAPCLATRFPYGTRLTREAIERVGAAEAYLHTLGYEQVRVRYYESMARIEVPATDLPGLLEKREQVLSKFKELGFIYAAVDLAGYRTGSLNEVLKK